MIGATAGHLHAMRPARAELIAASQRLFDSSLHPAPHVAPELQQFVRRAPQSVAAPQLVTERSAFAVRADRIAPATAPAVLPSRTSIHVANERASRQRQPPAVNCVLARTLAQRKEPDAPVQSRPLELSAAVFPAALVP